MLLLAYYFTLKRLQEMVLFNLLDPEVQDTCSIPPEYQQVLVEVRFAWGKIFYFLFVLPQLNLKCAFCLAIKVTYLIADKRSLPLFPIPWTFNIKSLHMKIELQTIAVVKIFYWSNSLSIVFVISSDHSSCIKEVALLYRNPLEYRDYFHLQLKFLSLLAPWEKLMSSKY